jgi:hypothetical protein
MGKKAIDNERWRSADMAQSFAVWYIEGWAWRAYLENEVGGTSGHVE